MSTGWPFIETNYMSFCPADALVKTEPVMVILWPCAASDRDRLRPCVTISTVSETRGFGPPSTRVFAVELETKLPLRFSYWQVDTVHNVFNEHIVSV